jgi:hypothetical protein
MPPLGMLFGWLILDEHVALADLTGVIPVALGIYLVTRPVSPPPRSVVSIMETLAAPARAPLSCIGKDVQRR